MSPLLESSIDGATGVLINFTGGKDMTLQEVNEAAMVVADRVDQDANIIFGAIIEREQLEEVRVMVLATGFSCEPRIHSGGSSRREQTSVLRPKQEARQREDDLMPTEPERPIAEDEDLDVPAFLRKHTIHKK